MSVHVMNENPIRGMVSFRGIMDQGLTLVLYSSSCVTAGFEYGPLEPIGLAVLPLHVYSHESDPAINQFLKKLGIIK